MTMGRIRWEYFFIFTAYFMLHNLGFAVFGQDTLEILDFFSEGEVGKNATISCQFAPETGNTTWMFNDVEIKQDKRVITTNQAKDHGVDIDGNKKKYMVSNLTVTNATSKDDGNYTCIVNWHNKTLERTAVLDLSFPGKLVSSTPGPLRKNVTESVELECIFEIYKQSPVKWWSNSEKESILYDPKIINVKQIKSSHKAYIKSTADNGTYHCEVYDSVTDHNITGTIDVLVLDKPTMVIDTVKAIGAHKLFLNWTVNANNLPLPSYTLKYKTINDTNYRFSPKTIHSNYTSFIMDDLEKLTSYNIVMEVWNSYGKNIYSYPEAVTTLAEDPVFVPNITINGFSATSVTIGWAPPPREIAEYIHYYKLKAQKQNDTAIKETYHPSSNLPYMFDDLEPITTYIFKVQACSEYTKLCGNWSEPNIAMTLDGVPGKPSNVTIQCLNTDGSARQINVTWGPPIKRNAEIKAYSIELTGTASYIDEYGKRQLYKHGPKTTMAMNTSKSTTLREQLMPNTNYTVKVNALTRMRRRGDGEVVQCYTSPAPPDHAPRVRWEKIFDNGYFFKVNLQRESERNGTFCCYRVYMVKMFTREGIKDLPEDPRDLDVISHADAHGYKHVRGAYVTDVFSSKYFPPNGELIMGDDHSINNATCSRCLQVPRKLTTTETPTTQDIEDLLAVTEIPLKKKRAKEFAIKDNNIDYLELRVLPDMPINMDIDNIEVRDGKLDPLYNYTMFVELIPANDNDISIYGKYQDLLMPAPNKTIADNNNVIQVALQVTVGVLALVLLFLIFVCIRHSRRSRKLPHNNVEMNSIQATLSSIYHSLKGGRHQLVATAPPDMPAISKEDLAEAYIERQADSDYGFQKEFEMLPDGFPDRTTHASEARENMGKNRYPDIKAYDQTRVKLAQIDSIVGSDYINANYVMGYKDPTDPTQERKKFICAQGPTDATVTDFWRMIWEHGLELIVMLTNLEEYSKVKCSRYWPDDVKGTRNFGSITVTNVSEKRYSDYIVRELKITKQLTNAEGQPIVENNGIAKRNGDPTAVSPSGSSPPSPRASPDRIVRQYHFLMWKDFAAPEHPHSILKFIKRVNCAWSSLMGRPVVVHCSAGVGRTGTLVALDCLLQQLKHEGQVNVFNTVAELRRQRNFLVQSLKQYVFVYRALVEFAHYGDTEIPASKLKSSVDRLRNTPEGADKCLMEVEFEKMLSSPIPEVVKSCAAGAGEELRTKNRSQDCLPYDRNRVILTPMPGRDFSTYINASFIEAYDNSEGYIITQDPLPCTIPDFWRMVSEHNIATIVMLSELGDGDKKCPRYWDDGTAQYEHISVQYDHSESCPYYTKREFRVTNNKCGTTRTVQQLQYHGWPTVSGQVPEVTRGLAELADAAQTVPLLVHCQLGTERSSMFIALCILIVQLRTERRVDVSCVARKIRYQRHHTLDTFLQYEFLHRAILNYAELHNLLEDS